MVAGEDGCVTLKWGLILNRLNLLGKRKGRQVRQRKPSWFIYSKVSCHYRVATPSIDVASYFGFISNAGWLCLPHHFKYVRFTFTLMQLEYVSGRLLLMNCAFSWILWSGSLASRSLWKLFLTHAKFWNLKKKFLVCLGEKKNKKIKISNSIN